MENMSSTKKFSAPCVIGDESIMSKKSHGTSETAVQQNLKWNADRDTADRICNFNRHYAGNLSIYLPFLSIASRLINIYPLYLPLLLNCPQNHRELLHCFSFLVDYLKFLTHHPPRSTNAPDQPQ